MKLLLDEHLAPRLAVRIRDAFPGSLHVVDLGLQATPDAAIWRAAGEGGFALVTKDADFRRFADRFGPPPVVVLLKFANCPTSALERRLLAAADWLPIAVAGPGTRIVELNP